MNLNKQLRGQLALTTAMMAALVGYGRRAYAGSCTGVAGTYTCSGAATGTDTTQAFTGGPLTVTTSSDFGITASGDAFSLVGTGGDTFNHTGTGAITGSYRGLYAKNSGSGGISITSNGDIAGSGGRTLFAKNYGSGDLSIKVTSVTGPMNNYATLQTANYGGALYVSSTGTITGGTGMFIRNAGTSATVKANDVNAVYYGVGVRQFASGALSITTTGDVDASRGFGIVARVYSGSGLVINSATTSGGTEGILAVNQGTGDTSITTSGTTIGTGNNPAFSAYAGKISGIYAHNDASAKALTITTNGATNGADFGIYANNLGTGATTINTVGGAVTGTNQNGIQVTGTGMDLKIITADVTGGVNGILSRHTVGAGTTTIDTTAGTITGTSGNGIQASEAAAGLKITTADVTGGVNGIMARNTGTGATTIDTTAGTVIGTSTIGINAQNVGLGSGNLTITAGNVTGGTVGIGAGNSGIGTTSITTAGLVQGGGYGILASSSGRAQGIAINNLASGTIQNTSGSSSAGAIKTTGTRTDIVNSGLITGTVTLSVGANSFDNKSGGVWNTAGGANVLGPDTSSSVDNEAGGTIIAAASGASGPTATSFSGLGTFTNGGLLQMQNGVVGDTTTIAGNFVGTGGTVSLDTQLGGDGSPTDRLIINGDASGSTTLAIRNAGGAGAQTTNGIEVVEINGGTSTADAFHLASAVAVGAYDYALYYQDLTKDDQNWYLRSTGQANASAQTALPYADILVNFADATLGTLQQRTGNRIWPNGTPQVAADLPSSQVMKYAATGPVIYGQGAWGRIGGQYTSIDPKSGTPYTLSLGFLQAGYEGTAYETGAGDLTVGAYAMVGTSHADIDVSRDPATGAARSGKITTTGYGLGGNLTWLGADGLYADAVGQLTFYESSLSNKAGGDNQGWSGTASLEIGKRFELGSGWSVVPQAQLAYTHVDFDSFTDINSSRVTLGDGDSLRGRLGLRVENNASWKNGEGKTDRLQIYGIANLSYGFLKDTSVVVAGTSLEQQNKRLWGEVGLGGTYAWNDNWSVYGEADYATALSGSGSNYTVKGTAGLRYRW